jgi:hypothetical protein
VSSVEDGPAFVQDSCARARVMDGVGFSACFGTWSVMESVTQHEPGGSWDVELGDVCCSYASGRRSRMRADAAHKAAMSKLA